jgi:hypothetical protein
MLKDRQVKSSRNFTELPIRNHISDIIFKELIEEYEVLTKDVGPADVVSPHE